MTGPRKQRRGAKADTLSGKQQRFVEEYLIDRNGTQAAIRAGYSPRSAEDMAKQNLRTPKVAAAIAAASAQVTAKAEVTVDLVLRELVQNVTDARRHGDFAASNRACELLGKHLSMFVDRLEHRFTRDLDKLTDAELEQLAAGKLPA
ncbi:MAG: terminase small subunit [Gemmatimonadetes bacterium]|nr:terminase small subunit [Gemmatimonadota bacterium]